MGGLKNSVLQMGKAPASLGVFGGVDPNIQAETGGQDLEGDRQGDGREFPGGTDGKDQVPVLGGEIAAGDDKDVGGDLPEELPEFGDRPSSCSGPARKKTKFSPVQAIWGPWMYSSIS